jgi:transposase
MAAWLAAEGVTHVTMEATGIYWKPVFHALCEVGGELEMLLASARHVKNVPGRRRREGRRVAGAQLLECGLLRGSFIPPGEIAQIRELTRIPQEADRVAEQRAAAPGQGPRGRRHQDRPRWPPA